MTLMPHRLSKKQKDWWIGGFSQAAQTIFDRFTELPTAAKAVMATFIDAQITALGLLDSYWYFSLNTSANSLIDWNGLSNASIVNAPPFVSFAGFSLNGSTQHINSNFLPGTDGVNFQQDDAGVFAHIEDAPGSSEGIFGWRDGGAQRNQIAHNAGPTVISFGLQGTVSLLAATTMLANSTYVIERDDSANQKLLKEGVQIDTRAVVSSAIVDKELYFGARNNNDTADFHYTGIVKCGCIGAGSIDWASFSADQDIMIAGLNALQ